MIKTEISKNLPPKERKDFFNYLTTKNQDEKQNIINNTTELGKKAIEDYEKQIKEI